MNAKDKKTAREAVHCDHVRFLKDGTVEFKRSYFYRMGNSAESFAAVCAKRLTHAGFSVTDVQSFDSWAAWPKTSYFIATMKVELQKQNVETA